MLGLNFNKVSGLFQRGIENQLKNLGLNVLQKQLRIESGNYFCKKL